MALQITTADERRAAKNKTSIAIFGPYGVGKTSLLHTLPPDYTLAIDLEAGMKSVQSWPGASIEIRDFRDFQDLTALIGGVDPAVSQSAWYSQSHHSHVAQTYAGSKVDEFVRTRPVIFIDSITDLTRLAMTYAQQQPEAFSDRSGKPDTRGAYGLLAREVIRALKHLQRANGRTVIFVGLLDLDMETRQWVPQMEGSKSGKELPGIVDQVISMQFFERDAGGELQLDRAGTERHFVCKEGNRWGLPAKDRSGRLDVIEPPDLNALLNKINAC
jgi:hypothetical protein